MPATQAFPPLHLLVSPSSIADLAVQAAVLEASATPKPGLVCIDTQGSHPDMDILILTSSAFSLRSYFYDAVLLGQQAANEKTVDVLEKLRLLGLETENNMFLTTKHVNTHKGLIFSLGLLCTALGVFLERRQHWSIMAICDLAGSFVQGIVNHDFSMLTAAQAKIRPGTPRGVSAKLATIILKRRPTAGEILYLQYNVTGARGEAEAGFPHVQSEFATFMEWQEKGDYNQAIVNTLLGLMSTVEDTNILWRGNLPALRKVQELAYQALLSGGATTREGMNALHNLEILCVSEHLSPGGSADLLTIIIFFHLLTLQAEAQEEFAGDLF